jgi:DNA repair protein RadD
MYKLRDYQERGKQEIYSKIRAGKRRLIMWVPTGGGKGLMMSDLVKDVANMGKTTMTVMRRRELIFQTQKNYNKYHQHLTSIIMGNDKGYVYGSPHQICSIDTIRTRMLMDAYQYLAKSRLFIIDECHDSNSPTYQRMFEWILKENPDAIFIGFTATPFTVGGKPLDFWQDYVQPIKPSDMRDLGWLVPVVHYAPEGKINTVGLKVEQGDFKEKDLFQRASDSVIVGDVVSTWIKLGENRPTLMFCVNKEHSQLMAAAFNLRGIPAIHVDESTTSAERAAALADLKSGKYKIISSIETMTTGIDAPFVSCLVMARPTWSEVLYVQTIGRGLRPYKVCADCGFEYGAEKECLRCKSHLARYVKKDCIVLDHAANAERHGFAYDDRQAKLKHLMGIDEQKKYASGAYRKVAKPVTICETCYVYVSPGQPCSVCGVVKKNIELPKEESGELKLIDEATVTKLKLNQMLSEYQFLKNRAMIQNRPENGIWFSLHKKFNDLIFQSPYKETLGVPNWVESKIWAQKQREVYERGE